MEEEEKSFLDEKREKSNKNATKTTQALDNAADIASFTPAAGFAEGYKKFRAIDNAVTGGKLTHLGAKVVNVASPTVKYASKLVGSKPVTAITNVATLPERFVGGKQKPSDKAKTAKSGKSTDASVKGNKSDISKAKSQGQTQTGSSEGSSDGKKSGLNS